MSRAAVLEKLKFWKREHEMQPGSLEPFPSGLEQAPTPAIPPLEPTPLPEPAFQQTASMTAKTSEKDLEVIAAKLDVLKAQLDNIIQRLDHLERQQESGKVRW